MGGEESTGFRRSGKEKLKWMRLVMPPGTKMAAQLLTDHKGKERLFRDHQTLTKSIGGLG